MKNVLSIILALIAFSHLQAQLFDSISIGNINARIWSDGIFFWDKVVNPKFECPKGSGNHANFATSIWFGAQDPAGQLLVAAQDFNQNGHDFWAGPIVGNSGTYSATYDQTYNRVWKITKADIDYHIANFQNAGYIAPQSIIDWPGNGNVANAEPAQIAPYVDTDNDLVYNPLNGDYPLIKGDEAIFTIINDKRGIHGSGGAALGIEIRILFYGFNAPNDPVLNSTLFVSFNVKNRSGFVLRKMYMGVFDDFDLGYFKDDFVGCDTSLNLFYCYNADNDDSGLYGYGQAPPAIGVTFLNRPMHSFLFYKNTMNANIGNPFISQDYYHYLSAYWKDGSHIVANNMDGYFGTAPGANTNYILTGLPESQQGWIESGVNQPDDRRGLGNNYIDSMKPNQSICVDLAWIVAQDTSNLMSIVKLRTATQVIQDYYDLNNLGCSAQTTVSTTEAVDIKGFSIAPNPTSANNIKISGLKEDSYQLSIWSMEGKCVYQQSLSIVNGAIVNIPNHLTDGLYLIEINNESVSLSQKLWVKR